MRLSITLLLSSAASAAAMPPKFNETDISTRQVSAPGVCNFEQLQTIIFTGSLAEWTKKFQAVGRAPCYNWCTDGCTSSPDFWQDSRTLFSPSAKPKIDLRPACARHDFAYRNLKRYKAFTDENKLKADEKLREGIIELCVGDEACSKAATDVYFNGVRPVDSPAAGHNRWDASEGASDSTCNLFPGCCSDHSSPTECGARVFSNPAGDGSCMFKG